MDDAAMATCGGSPTLIPPSGTKPFVSEPCKSDDASKVVPVLAKRELERDGEVGALLLGCLVVLLEEEDKGGPEGFVAKLAEGNSADAAFNAYAADVFCGNAWRALAMRELVRVGVGGPVAPSALSLGRDAEVVPSAGGGFLLGGMMEMCVICTSKMCYLHIF
jgi:hypothetical protein